jgi:hypothetical protein
MSIKNRLVSVRTKVAIGFALIVVASLVLPSGSFLNRFAMRTVHADTSPQTLPFSQNWTTTTLITTDDNWAGVPGIIGYRGDDAAAGTGVDPQTPSSTSMPIAPIRIPLSRAASPSLTAFQIRLLLSRVPARLTFLIW